MPSRVIWILAAVLVATACGGAEPCLDGERLLAPCGNCGTREKTCEAGVWGEWSDCTAQGECAADEVGTEACGTDEGSCVAGTRSRTCSEECVWGAWSECGGSYLGPSPETCGDEEDDDCNGATDEGCACAPVELGEAGSVAVAGPISELVADPSRCFLYALTAGDPAEVIVVETGTKTVLERIELGEPANDIDISPSGDVLAVAHDALHFISVIDLVHWTVASEPATGSDPWALEVDDAGRAWYLEEDQWVDLRTLDLATGIASDSVATSWGVYEGDLEMGGNGAFLYAGESGISGGTVYKYQVAGTSVSVVDQSTWDDGYGFPYPSRDLYLSPGGQHVYYARHQLDATDLAMVRGSTDERIFAEDAAGTFAVGQTAVWDAELVRPVASLGHTAGAAALVSADRELWTWDAPAGRLRYASADEYVFGVALGQRELAPEPLDAYTFSEIVHDPVRPRLYGLDALRGSVVAIDLPDLTPAQEILVGSTPTDIDVDPSGSVLWVGHFDVHGATRIDLTDLTWDGLVSTPSITYEVEALANEWFAAIEEDQWVNLVLVDGQTGTVADEIPWAVYEGAIEADRAGTSLFVGEAHLSGAGLYRYDVGAGTLYLVDESDYDGGYGFPYPDRRVAVAPDASGVFYAGYYLDGSDLSVLTYAMSSDIRTVTDTHAISATTVYDLATGSSLGTLSSAGAVQAASPDGESLYVASGGAIHVVDLTAF